MKLEVKPSQYNILHESENQNLCVFNTKSGVAVSLDDFKQIKDAKAILLKDFSGPYNEELIKEFTKLGFMVKHDIDETEDVINGYKENYIRNKKLHITIFPTLRCNFSCNYCFVDIKTGFEMEKNTFEAILLHIDFKLKNEKDLNEIEIVWFGGEPLLAKANIISFMKKLNKLNISYNKKISSVIVTNGYLLNLDTFKMLHEAGVKNYQVTFDGYKDTHDTLRHLENSVPTFDVIMTNLLEIKSAFEGEYKINIRSNFMKDTVQSQFKLIDYLQKRLLKDNRFSIEFKPIQDILGNGIENICSDDLNDDSIISFTRYLANNIQKKSSQEYSYSLLPLPINKWCNASLSESIIVKPNGEIYACDSCISDKNQIIGIITDEGFINYTETSKMWKGYIELEKECRCCILLPVCMGGCRRKRLKEIIECPISKRYIIKCLDDYLKNVNS